MNTETVTLKLPRALLSQAFVVAEKQDVTIGHLVRKLLRQEVDRQLTAKPLNRADERLVVALQALLAQEMALAENWADLALRLADEGYALRPAGCDLSIHKRLCGTRLCKASELGFSYRALVTRIRSAMPGHPHGALNLVFEMPPQPQPTLPLEGNPQFEVIDFDA